MNYFAIQCFPDTYNLVREGPNKDPYVMDLMVRAKKILGHEGRCGYLTEKIPLRLRTTKNDSSLDDDQCEQWKTFPHKHL